MEMRRFEIVTCCGDHCEYFEMEVPVGADLYTVMYDVLAEAGYPNRQCEQCYDSAYRVKDA